MMNVVDFYTLTFVILCTIISLGVLANIVSLTVWTKGWRCRAGAYSAYFKLLAATDLFVLLVPGTDSLLKYMPGRNLQLRVINTFLCKFMMFSAFFGIQLSTWISVAMTIHCTVTLCYPVRFYQGNNRKRWAYVVFCFIVLFLFLLNIPIGLDTELVVHKKRSKAADPVEINTIKYCSNPQLQGSPTNITLLKYISVIGFYIILPTLIFLACNIIILVKMCRVKHFTSVHRLLIKNLQGVIRLTIYITSVRIISALPVLLTFLVRFNIIRMEPVHLRILSVVSYACLYLSNAVNCLLYILGSRHFRLDLKDLCTMQLNGCLSVCKDEQTRYDIECSVEQINLHETIVYKNTMVVKHF